MPTSRPLLFLALAIGLLCGPAVAQEARPNIILVVTDDQRDDLLGCAGHPVLRTPHIDALAAEGVRFTNAFVTTPICAASRASILTGAWESAHGYTFGTPPLREELVAASYPALLREAGYRTGLVGKFGVRVPDGASARMFDVFRPMGQPFVQDGADGQPVHLTDRTRDEALAFLRGCAADQPFCLSISFNAPHAQDADKDNQYPCAPAEAGLYADAPVPAPLVPETFREGLPDFLADSLCRERWFWRWDTADKYTDNVRAYYRMLTGIDRVVGEVLAESARLGFADNTVVLFVGDNGYFLGSRGFAGKWLHYEEALRVPLVVHDPRVAAPARGLEVPAMALNVDLAATVLDYAGVEPPPSCRGRSLVPWVRGDAAADWRVDFYAEHRMEHAKIPEWEGVRGTRWTYARYVGRGAAGEFLHDLEADPLQLVNLAGQAESAETLEQMRARCEELRP